MIVLVVPVILSVLVAYVNVPALESQLPEHMIMYVLPARVPVIVMAPVPILLVKVRVPVDMISVANGLAVVDLRVFVVPVNVTVEVPETNDPALESQLPAHAIAKVVSVSVPVITISPDSVRALSIV